MSYSIKTQVDFEAAHRLYDVNTYAEECRENIHGHSYKVTVVFKVENLNDAGMVIDFKLIKKILKDCIESKYDHSCILKCNDPLVELMVKHCKKVIVVESNPTAEWMSKQFYLEITKALRDINLNIEIASVAVQETEHNIAIYEPSNVNNKLKVVEIFKSIDGEGIRSGYPVTFIRLHGCNLSCSYCDSRYACEDDSYAELTVAQIMKVVENCGLKNITLTGGEPLIHENVDELIEALTSNGYSVNVETNGSVNIEKFRNIERDGKKLFFTLDYKCNSSNMEDKMDTSNFRLLTDKDVLKFVVGSKEDLDKMRFIINNNWNKLKDVNVFVSPVFGKIDPQDIVMYIIEKNIPNVRMQLQLHKFIWDPNKRGV